MIRRIQAALAEAIAADRFETELRMVTVDAAGRADARAAAIAAAKCAATAEDVELALNRWHRDKISAAIGDAAPQRQINVWFPLWDTPVTVNMSEEQLVLIVEALRGPKHSGPQAWFDYIAEELSR